MRIIKFEHGIEMFQDIEKEYNVNGYWFKDHNYERNLAEFAEWEDDEEDFEYSDSKGNSHYGKPEPVHMYSDEEWVTDLEGFVDDHQESLDPDDLEYAEFVSWWDGSNWTKIYLTADWVDSEDITDEWLPSYEQKTWIGNNRENRSTGWEEFYYSDGVIWQENVSLWQGTRNTWQILEDEDSIDIIFAKFTKDHIQDLRPELFEKYGTDFRVESVDVSDFYEELSWADVWEIVPN